MTQEEIDALPDDADIEFEVRPSPVVCFPRILAENLTKIDSVDLHIWMYFAYSKDVGSLSANEFKNHLKLSKDQISISLQRLEALNLIQYNEESEKWSAKNGMDFRF